MTKYRVGKEITHDPWRPEASSAKIFLVVLDIHFNLALSSHIGEGAPMKFTALAGILATVLLAGCASPPSFQDLAVGRTSDGEVITPADVVAAVRCELNQATTDGGQNLTDLKRYVVVAALTLKVDDNGGTAPSLSFIDPTEFTFSLSGQLSGTRQRVFTQSVQFNMWELNNNGCASRASDGLHVNGINLLGTLGLAEIAKMGLSIRKGDGVHFPADKPGIASNDRPAFGSTVQFTLTKAVGLGPTWIVSHFKGPSGSGASGGNLGAQPGLISGGRTDTHLILLTFVPVEPTTVELEAMSPVRQAEIAAAASAAAQAAILDLRLQLLQGTLQ